jgi:opacity protein-like surface antigen
VVESGSQSIDDSSGLFSYKVGGGLGIFLNKKVSLDLGLGYSSNSTKLNSDNNVDLRRIQNRIGLEIGIVVFL